MKRFRLDRRTFLKGVGASVALPTLECMLNSGGTAFAQGQPFPRRYATWFFGNGIIRSKFNPSTTGPNWALTPELAPLANVKPYVNVVTGYMIKTPNLRGHHNGVAGIFSGHPFIVLPAGNAPYASKFGGPSIDQVAADHIKGNTLFPSLQLRVSKRVTTGEGPTLDFLSHRGPDAPLTPEDNPAALYNRLFASFTPKDPTDPKDRMRASVLDAVKGDLDALKPRLSVADRQRMDQHLTGLSELRTQILALPPVITSGCTVPAPVTETNADINGKEQWAAVNKAFADMLALAFACDLTRVASFQFSGSVGGHVFDNLGQTETNHSLTHDSAQTAQDQVHESVVFVMQQYAYLLEKLKSLPEGASGNLLDQSLVFASSDASEGLAHSIDDYPIILGGKAGGAMKYPGVHHRGQFNPNTSEVLLATLRAVGANVASVGSGSGLSATPCVQVLA
jgi:Protein of unknown function (DUF1552)